MKSSPQPPLGRALDLLCLLMLIAMALYLVIAWQSIPEQVPLHYTADGSITSWGGRSTVLIMPIFALLTYVPMRLIDRFPEAWNMPRRAFMRNPQATTQATRVLLAAVRTSLLLVSLLFTVLIAQARPAPWFMLPATLALVFAPIAIYFVHIVRLGRKPVDPEDG